MIDTLLTPAEVAVILRVKKNTLAIWRMKGVGPEYVRMGRRIFYRPEAIEAYLKENTRSSTGAEAHA